MYVKHIGILKPDTLVGVLNWFGIPLFLVYFISMFVYPWHESAWNWQSVQDTWDRWQSLNVAMLALLSSVIALNISRFNAEHQRQRDFTAAKAYLPATLSELCRYFENSASALNEAWNASRNAPLEVDIPSLPTDYRDVFSECIRHAEADVGDYLAKTVSLLQIHDARLRGLVADHGAEGNISPNQQNVIVYMYRLGELQAMVNRLFGFARGDAPFDDTPVVWDEFRSALAILNIELDDIYVSEIMNLEAFTKRALARGIESA